MKLTILDGYCLNPGDLSWDAVESLAETTIYDRTPAHLVEERIAGSTAVLTNKTPLTREVLSRAGDLRYIGVLATGYNIVDTAAARERGIVVTNVPTYGTDSVAQFAIALLLELCHHVGGHSASVRSGDWSRSADWSFWNTPLIELAGKTMGIVGYGRIGRRTAAIASALGMRIVAHDQVQPAGAGVEWLELDELLRVSDVVSLHCPLTQSNGGMINATSLGLMKRTAFLLNTSRGPLVVDADLAAALNEGVIAGAGLDVLSVEPPLESNPLIGAKNCIVTPHMAWATKEARARLLDQVVENLRAFAAGSPINVVNA